MDFDNSKPWTEDFDMIAEILSYINTDAIQLEQIEYLPSDFWKDLEDPLLLADMVVAGWATPTDPMGKSQLSFAWRVLCDIREVDPEGTYATVEDFFKAQETKE